MATVWLNWANYILALLIAVIFFIGINSLLFTAPIEANNFLPSPPVSVPKSPFAQPPTAYEAIGHPSLRLQFSPLTPQLPDLRRYISYHGKNGRPDIPVDQAALHFSVAGQKSFASVLPGERLYLIYDKAATPPQYLFSPQNSPTSFWIVAKPENNFALIDVYAIDENGKRLDSPAANVQVKIPEKELARTGSANSIWEIDGQRVDATLFVRQKARWFGPDKFLEHHGGEEFKGQAGKQRLDFSEKENSYSVYLDPKDVLIWKDKHWQAVAPGPASQDYPLAVIKKIDDRIMTLELWDPEGKSKIMINLIKSGEAWNNQVVQQSFTYEGVRTRRQFIFEVNNERLLLAPNDWLLLTSDGWKKLNSVADIDNYVARRLTGILFIFFGVERSDGKQYLIGELYSPARSDMQKIELQVKAGSKPLPIAPNQVKKDMEKRAVSPVATPPGAIKNELQKKEDNKDDDSYSSSDWDSSDDDE